MVSCFATAQNVRKIGLFLALLVPFLSFSQVDSAEIAERPKSLCEIILKDGSSYSGYMQQQSDSVVYLKGSLGVIITLPKNQIAKIHLIRGHTRVDSTGAYYSHLPTVAHYYYIVSSNAFLFRKGEVYGSSSYGLWHNINYAFNHNVSLGISNSLIGAPVGLRLKINLQAAHKLYIGVEGFAGSLSYLGPQSYGEGGFLKITYGDDQKNFTFYGGYINAIYDGSNRGGRRRRGGGAGSYTYHLSSPCVGAAIASAISNKTLITAEAQAFPGISVYWAAIGIRTTFQQKISWVYGMQAVHSFTGRIAAGSFIPLPYVGFSYRL